MLKWKKQFSVMGAGLQELERHYVMSHQIRALTNIEILLRSQQGNELL